MEGVSRQKFFGKEGAGFFSTNSSGGKIKSCTLYNKINSVCQGKSILSFEYIESPKIALKRAAVNHRSKIFALFRMEDDSNL
ncbi:MAG: hypothetical protein EHM79_11090 [Geobacter sp.]|nr:MAG: hypothetical protein EHM79_11090 [Geobacter sp.]